MSQRRKPGPLSSKRKGQSVSKRSATRTESQANIGLGDDSTSDSLENSEENVDPRQSSNGTDYGLDFTNTSIYNMSPPTRSSTLRRRSPLRPSEDNRGNNDEEPSTSLASRLVNLSVSTRNRRQESSQSSNRQQETQQPQVARERRPRKRRTPQQRERRFIREIKQLRNRVDFLIPRAPFGRVVREILRERCGHQDVYVTVGCLEALQTAAESYLAQRLEDAYLLTLHRGRVTLELRDLRLVSFLAGNIH